MNVVPVTSRAYLVWRGADSVALLGHRREANDADSAWDEVIEGETVRR